MANLVTETEQYRRQPRIYNRPILNTLAIGIELFMKAYFLNCGASIADVKSYGHDLWKLWKRCPDPHLAKIVIREAERVYDQAVLDDLAKPSTQLQEEFCNQLRCLSKRHSRSGSQLRYLAPSGTKAPRVGWLVQTFYIVADRSLRNTPFEL